jgi:hypothetical protein
MPGRCVLTLTDGQPGKRIRSLRLLGEFGHDSGYEDDVIAFGYEQKKLAKTLKARIGELNGQPDEAICDIRSGFDADSNSRSGRRNPKEDSAKSDRRQMGRAQ